MAVAPTARHLMLKKAGEALGPDKSIERLNSLGQLLLTSVAIVGAVLTGLGAFSDIGDQLADEPGWLLPPIVFVIATVILALAALAPQPQKFNPANLTEIDGIYARRILWKQIFVIGGFFSLALAIVTAGAPGLWAAFNEPDPSAQISIGWNTIAGADGSTSRVIQSAVALDHVPNDSTFEVLVTTGRDDVLAARNGLIGPSGEVDLILDSSTRAEVESATLSVAVTKGGVQILSDEVTSPAE